jgi:hypothetical protein
MGPVDNGNLQFYKSCFSGACFGAVIGACVELAGKVRRDEPLPPEFSSIASPPPACLPTDSRPMRQI